MKTNPLDQKTIADLEIKELVAPLLTKSAYTELGAKRIEWSLKNPMSETKDILEAQKQIQILIESPKLLKELNLFFSNIQKLMSDNHIQELLSKIKEYKSTDGKSDVQLGRFLIFLSYAGLLTAIYMGDTRLVFGTGLLFFAAGHTNWGGIDVVKDMAKVAQYLKRSKDLLAKINFPELRPLTTLNSKVMNEEMRGLINTLNHLPTSSVVQKIMSGTFVSSAVNDRALKKIMKNESKLAEMLSALAQLEMYTVIANHYVRHESNLIFPNLSEKTNPHIYIEKGHHPHLMFDIQKHSRPQKVSFSFVDGGTKFILLTGANTGGKSTYLKIIGVLTVMAQMGFPVPAQSMSITPTKVVSSLNNSDSISSGKSSFYSQSERVAQVTGAMNADKKSILILIDEILTGTTAIEHSSSEQATIEYLYNNPNSFVLLATHSRSSTHLEETLPGLTNYYISRENHEMKKGVSNELNAPEVMSRAGVPHEIVERTKVLIKEKSQP